MSSFTFHKLSDPHEQADRNVIHPIWENFTLTSQSPVPGCKIVVRILTNTLGQIHCNWDKYIWHTSYLSFHLHRHFVRWKYFTPKTHYLWQNWICIKIIWIGQTLCVKMIQYGRIHIYCVKLPILCKITCYGQNCTLNVWLFMKIIHWLAHFR